jgi:putative ABC transport system permease protein
MLLTSVAFWGAVELGLLYAIMALGVYITFRILNFPDLTVDGSFVTGASISAVMIVAGYSPAVSVIFAFAGGFLAGAATGLLHTKGKINALLSGILMMIALYSINLRIMGKANIPLLGETTLFPAEKIYWFGVSAVVWIMPVVVFVIKLVIDWFLHTDIGLALRATGDNQRMIRSFGVNTDATIVLGVSLSNGLVALSGALVAQYSGYSEVSMGVGMIIIGLASVIIGETLFGQRTVFRATLAVMLGAIVYRLAVAVALDKGLQPTDMKLMTALLVIIALVLPMIRRHYRETRIGRKRSMELAGQSTQSSGQE